tara:strand:+ start:725 stop:1210 length:486 start_codon:yes stop_codon:yes gene_type:complete
MNSSLNNLVGASERKNNRKKTVVRATRGSEVNISEDMLKGGGKIKVVARRNSKININKPSSTASSPSKVAKSDTTSTSTPIVKPAKADVVTATPKPKTTATKPKTTKPKTTKPKTTKPKNTFVPTTQKLPTTQQDNTKTKYGGQPSDTPTFVLGRFTGLNL